MRAHPKMIARCATSWCMSLPTNLPEGRPIRPVRIEMHGRNLLAIAFQIKVGFPGQIAERLRRELYWKDDLTPLAVESLCLDMLVSTSRRQRICHEPAPSWLFAGWSWRSFRRHLSELICVAANKNRPPNLTAIVDTLSLCAVGCRRSIAT